MFVVKRNPKLPENVNIINVRLKERYPVYLSFFAHVMSFHQKSALYGIFIAGTGYIVKKSFGLNIEKFLSFTLGMDPGGFTDDFRISRPGIC